MRNVLEQTHIMFRLVDGSLKECKPEDLNSSSEKVIATDAQKEYIKQISVDQLARTEVPNNDEGILICESNNNLKQRKSWFGEKEFRLIGAIQSTENGYAGLGIMAGMLVAISIFSQPHVSCTVSTSSESSGGDEWPLIAPMSRGKLLQEWQNTFLFGKSEYIFLIKPY